METYNKIQSIFRRDMDGSRTGQKGKMMLGEWSRPELAYLADNQWTFSSKVDGTNIRIGYKPVVALERGFGPVVEFAGRTDKAVLPKPLLKHIDETFNTKVFEEVFADLDSSGVTLFGEGYGAKIQGGGRYREDQSFILFDVKVGDFWLDREDVSDVADKLGIDVVPEIGRGTLWDALGLVRNGLKSEFGDFEEEGLVCRPMVPLFNRKGERIIVKIKGVDFR